MNAVTLHFHPLHRPRGRVARLGDWLARHRTAVFGVQWAVVVAYAVLVTLPAFLPLPVTGSTMLDNLTLAAQFLFWGIWWPFVIVSIMLFGRAWCGLLCPEGALAEFASWHGRGGSIPRWLRWGGWPFVAFVLTTIYGQLISVYEYPKAALLILGGSTVAAVLVGYLYGRGKRVWCRFLCPVSGVFALLARLAPLHFAVDRAAWEAYPERTKAADCPPLLNVKHLGGASQCHACGRCSGHRDAVRLAVRSPEAEILAPGPVSAWESNLLLFGILGVAVGAFQWSANPWFVMARQKAAEWLVEREIFWPLNPPIEGGGSWWLLTNYPAAQDVFTWLDGGAILAYIATVAIVVGGTAWVFLQIAARLLQLDWRRLALALTPLGGIGLFLGLSMLTLTQLRAEGIVFGWLPVARGVLLALAVGWSLRLAYRLSGGVALARRAAALVLVSVPVGLVAGLWAMLFYVW
jgi:hypothetical protein